MSKKLSSADEKLLPESPNIMTCTHRPGDRKTMWEEGKSASLDVLFLLYQVCGIHILLTIKTRCCRPFCLRAGLPLAGKPVATMKCRLQQPMRQPSTGTPVNPEAVP